jgi:hypothetical protein
MKEFLLGSMLSFATFLGAQTPAAKQVHKIYVGEFHNPDNPNVNQGFGEFVRSKMISSLAQRCGSACTVVETGPPSGDDDEAGSDGILTGMLSVESNEYHHRYRVQGAMRLVDKNGTVVWSATIYSSPLTKSATSSFCDNTAKKLTAFLSRQ